MDSRAYTEVNYIINEMSSEMKSKIPYQILKKIEDRKDKNYEFYIEDEDFENVELLEDTEKMLSVLYTDYLASDEEKIVIKNKEEILERKKKEKLSNIEIREIFPKAKKKNENIEREETESWSLVSLKPEKWYIRVINFFKRVFKE